MIIEEENFMVYKVYQKRSLCLGTIIGWITDLVHSYHEAKSSILPNINMCRKDDICVVPVTIWQMFSGIAHKSFHLLNTFLLTNIKILNFRNWKKKSILLKEFLVNLCWYFYGVLINVFITFITYAFIPKQIIQTQILND
jgi:hypothetical protein